MNSDQKTREGFKLLGQHKDGCLGVRDGEPFVITDRQSHDFSRRRDGTAGGSTMWWRFVCNDIDCKAVLLVRWDQIKRFINGSET